MVEQKDLLVEIGTEELPPKALQAYPKVLPLKLCRA
jgi:glycyl-tRNA synthetase beta subunit